MTLKQFFQIAGGALIALIFYASPLHPIIKWPAIIFFGLAGVALAFLPFEERPLDKWVIAFFKSVYSPTLFFWKKTTKPPVFFKEDAAAPEEKIVAPHGEKVLEDYLATRHEQKPKALSTLEEAEQTFLSKISKLFIKVDKKRRPKLVVEEEKEEAVEQKAAPVAPTVQAGKPISGQAAQFSVDAAPPSPPTQPNTMVGQVMDPQAKIIEGAILEIRDAAGRPVRALKSNKLGHFMIVTPLQDGKYEITIEKEGYEFSALTFEATGSIIPPIAVRAKKKVEPQVSEAQPATP